LPLASSVKIIPKSQNELETTSFKKYSIYIAFYKGEYAV
jgi:hypothetical protein